MTSRIGINKVYHEKINDKKQTLEGIHSSFVSTILTTDVPFHRIRMSQSDKLFLLENAKFVFDTSIAKLEKVKSDMISSNASQMEIAKGLGGNIAIDLFNEEDMVIILSKQEFLIEEIKKSETDLTRLKGLKKICDGRIDVCELSVHSEVHENLKEFAEKELKKIEKHSLDSMMTSVPTKRAKLAGGGGIVMLTEELLTTATAVKSDGDKNIFSVTVDDALVETDSCAPVQVQKTPVAPAVVSSHGIIGQIMGSFRSSV